MLTFQENLDTLCSDLYTLFHQIWVPKSVWWEILHVSGVLQKIACPVPTFWLGTYYKPSGLVLFCTLYLYFLAAIEHVLWQNKAKWIVSLILGFAIISILKPANKGCSSTWLCYMAGFHVKSNCISYNESPLFLKVLCGYMTDLCIAGAIQASLS